MFTDCMLCISTISKVKKFLVLLLIAERQENKSEYIMNLLSTEEATNFQAREVLYLFLQGRSNWQMAIIYQKKAEAIN